MISESKVGKARLGSFLNDAGKCTPQSPPHLISRDVSEKLRVLAEKATKRTNKLKAVAGKQVTRQPPPQQQTQDSQQQGVSKPALTATT